ncbi:hypothetical protein BH10PLA1_BH10PLA1_13630 [soil metagenome]
MSKSIRLIVAFAAILFVHRMSVAQEVPMDENKDLFTPRGASKLVKPPKNAKEAFEPTFVTLRCDHLKAREAVD